MYVPIGTFEVEISINWVLKSFFLYFETLLLIVTEILHQLENIVWGCLFLYFGKELRTIVLKGDL